MAASALAQTVYLRMPNTSFCTVTAATNATPIRLTVDSASGCGITTNGQLILVTEVEGNRAANIHLVNSSDTAGFARKVSGLSGNSFDLLDIASSNVAGSGTYTVGGRVGLATAYTLNSHPRVYLDGPSGAITASISDTGSTGRANASSVPFIALKNARAAFTHYNEWFGDYSGKMGLAAAFQYLADGNTTARDAALYNLRNSDMTFGGTPACDETKRGCGLPASSLQDYPSQYFENWAQKYSIERSLLSSPEKTAFADKFWNDRGWGIGGWDYTGVTRTVVPWKIWDTTNGTVSVTGTALTGTGTAFLTSAAVGDIIIAPHTNENTFAEPYIIAGIADNTHMTLNRAPNSISVPGGSHYMIGRAWTTGDPGLGWLLKHFEYNPICGGASDAGTVAETPLALCEGEYGNQAGYYFMATHNLVLARLMGIYLAGIAMCGDDPRACLALSLANEWYVDKALPRAMNIWTGFSQSNAGYHVGRMMNIMLSLQIATKNSIVSGPDYMGGNDWGNQAARWSMAAPLLNASSLVYLPNAEQATYVLSPQNQLLQNIALFYYNTSSTVKSFIKSWIGSQLTYDDAWIRTNHGEWTWEHFLYYDPAITPATPPTSFLFTTTARSVCIAIFGAGKCPSQQEAKYAAISRTGWTSAATYLAVNATASTVLDHAGDDMGMWPLMAKNGKILMAGDSSNLMGSISQRGYIEIGSGITNLEQFITGPSVNWAYGSDAYMVGSFNLTSIYKSAANVTAAHRQLLHLKAGSQDYIIDHATVSLSAGATIKATQHSYIGPGCGTPTAATCITLTRASGTLTNNQTTGRVNSKVVNFGTSVVVDTQNASNTDGSYTGGAGNTFRWAVCPAAGCGASATSLEYAIVHQPSTSSATMPTIVSSTSGSWRVIEIQDTTAPAVAVLTANGATLTSGSFTTTYSGTAQVVFSGVAAGTYDVSRNGTPACPAVLVLTGDNTLTCSMASGAISLAASSSGFGSGPQLRGVTMRNLIIR